MLLTTVAHVEKIEDVLCTHKPENQLLTEHEIVCRTCGMVLGIDNLQEVGTESTINLFQEIQPGGKAIKLESSYRIHETKFMSSSFSNACDKLNLPRYVSLDAWRLFVKLVKNQQRQKIVMNQQKSDTGMVTHNPVKLSNGIVAMFSLFVSCRRFGISRSDVEIRKVVKLSFSLKQLPTMLKVFSLVKPIAIILGIKPDEDHLEYYVNLYLRKYGQESLLLPNRIKQQVRYIAHSIAGSDETKARLAVKIVLAGLGVKFV